MTDAAGDIALVLSGGGFRATLFHLGVVRYLAESGHLKRVTHICSVSGGSVLAAHVAVNWDAYTDRPETFDDTARGLLDFVRRDVRGRIIRRWIAWQLSLVPSICRGLGQLRPLRFLARFGEIGSLRRLLQREYDRLFGGRRLGDLGTAPDLHLLATSLTTGALASFSRAGFWLDERREFREISTERLPISLAVTASSAFPPLFPPVRVDNELLTVRRDDLPYAHYLGDGGVYDNLGIHRLRLLAERDGLNFSTVVVSDAGARSDWVTDDSFTSPLARNVRATDLLMSRVSHLDHDALRSGSWPNAVVVSLHDIVARADEPDALPPETQRSLATVRTDLDRFSEREIRLLDRHGYEVAKHRLDGHGHPERAEVKGGETAAQRERGPAARLRRADDEPPLQDANRVRFRAFSAVDWPSWLSLLFLACYGWALLYFVGQPFVGRWRFQQYARAQTAGGELRRAANVDAARRIFDSLQVLPPWPFDFRALGRVGGLVEPGDIRAAKLKLAAVIRNWTEGGPRPPDLDRAILEVTRAYGRSWRRESGEEAQRVFRDLRAALFRRASEVTTSIAFYTNLGAWSSTAPDRDAFWALYWGDLGLVEGEAVEGAMVQFKNLLPPEGRDDPEPHGGELLRAAAQLSSAIDQELGAAMATSGSPRSFSFRYTGPEPYRTENPGQRIWLLVRDGLWTERLPERLRGDRQYLFLPVIGRHEHQGCVGTLVYRLPDRRDEWFVPDRGCPDMTLWYRHVKTTGGEWHRVAPMEEVL